MNGLKLLHFLAKFLTFSTCKTLWRRDAMLEINIIQVWFDDALIGIIKPAPFTVTLP